MVEENVSVVIRCRPTIGNEPEEEPILQIDDPEQMSCLLISSQGGHSDKIFHFTKVYGPEDTTGRIYSDIGASIVEGSLNGYNGTIFAYGQTGSGKSYTIVGPDLYSPLRGILPRAIDHIFEQVSSTINNKYLILASFIEIYNEEIRDLLNKNGSNLELREHPDNGMFVEGVSLHPISSRKHCFKLVKIGLKNRISGKNSNNLNSSRSHAIFTLRIEVTNTAPGQSEHIKVGKLNIVDLAGSEKSEKSLNSLRFKESTKINLSLNALSNVITALEDGKHHIPYRESKLTRLLQDSLGGTAKTLMIACVSPSPSSYNETLSTLRYANRAKKIHNRPRINEDPKDAMLRKYQTEIDHLKNIVSEYSPNPALPGTSDKFRERDKIKQHYENQLKSLKSRLEEEHQSRMALLKEIDKYKIMHQNHLGMYGKQSENRQSSHKKSSSQSPLRSTKYNISYKDDKLESSDKDTSSDMSNDSNTEFEFVGNMERVYDLRKKAGERLKYLQSQMLGGKNYGENIKPSNEWGVMNDKIKKLEEELMVLQKENEADKHDYISTIEKQDNFIQLLTQIINKLNESTLPEDSKNLEMNKIIEQSKWDKEKDNWDVPKFNTQENRRESDVEQNKNTVQNSVSHTVDNLAGEEFIIEDNLEVKRTTTISPKREKPNRQTCKTPCNDFNQDNTNTKNNYEDSPNRKNSITFK